MDELMTFLDYCLQDEAVCEMQTLHQNQVAIHHEYYYSICRVVVTLGPGTAWGHPFGPAAWTMAIKSGTTKCQLTAITMKWF